MDGFYFAIYFKISFIKGITYFLFGGFKNSVRLSKIGKY